MIDDCPPALREILDTVRASAQRMLEEHPLPHDPEAPPGYARAELVEQHRRKQCAALRRIVEHGLACIEREYGPVAGGIAREHLAPLLAELERLGVDVH